MGYDLTGHFLILRTMFYRSLKRSRNTMMVMVFMITLASSANTKRRRLCCNHSCWTPIDMIANAMGYCVCSVKRLFCADDASSDESDSWESDNGTTLSAQDIEHIRTDLDAF